MKENVDNNRDWNSCIQRNSQSQCPLLRSTGPLDYNKFRRRKKRILILDLAKKMLCICFRQDKDCGPIHKKPLAGTKHNYRCANRLWSRAAILFDPFFRRSFWKCRSIFAFIRFFWKEEKKRFYTNLWQPQTEACCCCVARAPFNQMIWNIYFTYCLPPAPPASASSIYSNVLP